MGWIWGQKIREGFQKIIPGKSLEWDIVECITVDMMWVSDRLYSKLSLF